jgi:hypothetical protein
MPLEQGFKSIFTTNKRVYLFKTPRGLELNFLRFSCEFTYSVRRSPGLVTARLVAIVSRVCRCLGCRAKYCFVALQLVVEERQLGSHLVNSLISHRGERGSVPDQFM